MTTVIPGYLGRNSYLKYCTDVPYLTYLLSIIAGPSAIPSGGTSCYYINIPYNIYYSPFDVGRHDAAITQHVAAPSNMNNVDRRRYVSYICIRVVLPELESTAVKVTPRG